MRYNRSRKKQNRGGMALLSLVVLGVCVYALLASSAGKWVADNVLAPVFNTNKQENTDTPKTEAKGHSLNLDGFTAYTMQMGAFSEEKNAKASAQEIMTRGGAGYVFNDGSYRVLASAYTSEQDANTVKDQLKSQSNIDASVYTITVPKVDLTITSDDKNYDTLNAAFTSYLAAKDKVGELSLKLDKGEMNKDQALGELTTMKDELQKHYQAIEKLSEKNENFKSFKELYKSTVEHMSSIKDSDETLLSANLKNLYLHMICSYANYVKNIAK